MENENQKIKIIGRMQNGTYHEQLLTEHADSGFLAQSFLHAFSPAMLTEQLVQAYGQNSVLVFRTDITQMEEFRALLEEHGTSILQMDR